MKGGDGYLKIWTSKWTHNGSNKRKGDSNEGVIFDESNNALQDEGSSW